MTPEKQDLKFAHRIVMFLLKTVVVTQIIIMYDRVCACNINYIPKPANRK